MPDMTASPPNPAASPSPQGVGAGTAPGQPPFGSSPVTQPTPNRGHEAAGLSRLSIIVRLLEEAIPLLGAGSDPGKDAVKALGNLAKHIPPGSVTPGIEKSTMERLMQQQQQNAPQIAAMRAMQAGPQAGQPQGASAPAAPPQA